MDDKLFYILGQITYSFSRADFWISHLAVDLGLCNNYPEFMSKTRFENKIRGIINSTKDSSLDESLKKSIIFLMEELNELRKTRNSLVHSVVLRGVENDSNYLFYNYKKINSQTYSFPLLYNIGDLEDLNLKFVDIHNRIFKILERVRNM